MGTHTHTQSPIIKIVEKLGQASLSQAREYITLIIRRLHKRILFRYFTLFLKVSHLSESPTSIFSNTFSPTPYLLLFLLTFLNFPQALFNLSPCAQFSLLTSPVLLPLLPLTQPQKSKSSHLAKWRGDCKCQWLPMFSLSHIVAAQ